MSRRQEGRPSYYAVLGVQPGASAAEIRAAYHRLAMVSSFFLSLFFSRVLCF
jgi:hypothetical protein